VYGTIHVADARLEELPAAVRHRFDTAKSVMLEFVPDAYTRERFLEASMFLDQQTLEQKIGAEDFERAVEVLAPIGLPREVVNKLKPWGVLLNLRNPRRPAQAEPLDQQLAQRARTRRLPLSQIEGVEEQILRSDESRAEVSGSLTPREILSRKAQLLEPNFKQLVHDAHVLADHYTVALSANERLRTIPLVWPVPAEAESRTGFSPDHMWQATFYFLCEISRAIVAYGGYSAAFWDEFTFIRREPDLSRRSEAEAASSGGEASSLAAPRSPNDVSRNRRGRRGTSGACACGGRDDRDRGRDRGRRSRRAAGRSALVPKERPPGRTRLPPAR
jgi:hypothetical protein